MRKLLRLNNNHVGRPITVACASEAQREGCTHVTGLNLVPGGANPARSPEDIFHSEYEGEGRRHGRYIISMIPPQQGSSTLKWKIISEELDQYYALNHIQARSRVHNLADYNGLTARDTKQLIEVLPFILLKRGLMGNKNDSAKLQSDFHLWCLHVRVLTILSSYEVTFKELQALKVMIQELEEQYYAKHGGVRPNNHAMLHYVEDMENFGGCYNYWVWANEVLHGRYA